MPESFFTDFFRTSFRTVRGAYRGMRATVNRSLNAIDPPVVILVYHRVTELTSDPELLAVSPENFHRQMEFLRHNFRILRFEEDWAEMKDPAVVVTFDDGYADNVLEALPILEELGLPATFFVNTGHIGSEKEFWWHRLEGMLLHGGEFPPRFTLNDARYGRAWPTCTREERGILYASLNWLMQKVDSERREGWLDQVEKWTGRTYEGTNLHRSMSQNELRRLAASPWADIGAHTVTHAALSALDEGRQRSEIFSSKKALEDIIGREVRTFSYPFGRRRDYNRISVRLCWEAGFTKAAANFPGQVHRWTDPYQMPRHLVRNWDLDTFARELEAFWTR